MAVSRNPGFKASCDILEFMEEDSGFPLPLERGVQSFDSGGTELDLKSSALVPVVCDIDESFHEGGCGTKFGSGEDPVVVVQKGVLYPIVGEHVYGKGKLFFEAHHEYSRYFVGWHVVRLQDGDQVQLTHDLVVRADGRVVWLLVEGSVKWQVLASVEGSVLVTKMARSPVWRPGLLMDGVERRMFAVAGEAFPYILSSSLEMVGMMMGAVGSCEGGGMYVTALASSLVVVPRNYVVIEGHSVKMRDWIMVPLQDATVAVLTVLNGLSQRVEFK